MAYTVNPIIDTIINIYYNILFLFFRICLKMGIYTFEKTETYLDLDEKYINPIKMKFKKNEENQEINFNENIEHIFYDKKEFSICVSESNNILENKWRTRIIFESTTRGNIILFYDAYKMGFSYYSDQNIVSYDILNAVAMKYVTIFRCRDFFIDETIRKTSSPFIELYLKDDTKKTIKSSDKSAFVKLQNYSKNIKTQSLSKDTMFSKSMFSNVVLKEKEKEKVDEPEKMKNKFLYLGKICNFKITQTFPKKNKVLKKFSSPLLENIKLDSNVQRERMSYSDFKKSICKINSITE
jgi:hypothetical protein